ncbi:HAD superfamily hydrolase [Spiroplasma gladiatoris]|uniref:HAD superfamily hydrolase n=1 Tax=Spiroplasma gladiatoris TaxID=2143 RepID=A0A4P7AGB1_9MOLU|nr:HAD-IIB family hydrolase [Spiroplasma gladiatoris]QBQ07394.1 HAD superfamily hydrolase [Spiroplasma gladiatoris]
MLEKNIKLIALDMDGTSYYHLGEPVEANIDYINKALKKGIKVVFVTGRPHLNKKNRLDLYNFVKDESFLIGFNGAIIYDILEKKVIKETLISKEIIKKAFEITKKPEYKDIDMYAYSHDLNKTFINKTLETNELVNIEKAFYEGDIEVVNDNTEIIDCYKILLRNFNETLISEIKNLGLNIFWLKNSISAEVTHSDVSKANSLKIILDHFKIDRRNVLAMGDGANDIPMLEMAGLSIVPFDAKEKAKKHAMIVSKYKHNEGAVGIAIKKYILGE